MMPERSSCLADDLAQGLDLLGKPTIDGDPTAHPFAGVQYRRVITAEPLADHRQAGTAHHFETQQHSDVAGKHDARQVTPTE